MRVLITGVSKGGFGGATALRLARDAQARGETAKIVIAATGNRPLLRQAEEDVRALGKGVEVQVLTGDLSDPEVPAKLVADAVKFAGGLDAVVSNAGVFGHPTPITSFTTEEFDRFYSINVRAGWLLAKAAYPHLKASRGSIVFTASLAGLALYPGQALYSSTKAGVAMMMEMLAMEWGPQGIRVNAISPGIVRTPLNEDRLGQPEVAARLTSIIPAGRMGTPEEVAGTIAFLVGPDAGFVHGQNILVDGGVGRSSSRGPVAKV